MDVFASASLIGLGLSLSRRGKPGLRIFSATFILMVLGYAIMQDPEIWYGPDWKVHRSTFLVHMWMDPNFPPLPLCGGALWFFYESCDDSSAR